MEIEKVQQRAACWVLDDYGRFSSVTSMLDQSSWPTLQTYRKVAIYITYIAPSVLSLAMTYNSSVLLTSNMINETVSSITLYM